MTVTEAVDIIQHEFQICNKHVLWICFIVGFLIGMHVK